MIADTLSFRPESPQEIIRLLQRELAQTNREVMALTLELERRVDDRTSALQIAQQELQEKNARLEAANKELEAFSYSVSHDLRAPLRHLQGYAEALENDCAANLGQDAKDYLHHIKRAVEQMNALIDALLSFARTAQQPLKLINVNLDHLVREILSDLQPEQTGRRIEWIIHPLPVVRGDMGMLRQVWTNLIGNAVKYSRQREVARIEIGTMERSERELVFFVRDNGAGFDMAYVDQLFGLFQRLHSSDQFEGTGLGLAIVRRIIDRHGGKTWAEGEPGKGATFFFSLPKL